MIARIWRAWGSAATADNYQRDCESEVANHLQRAAGLSDARLLRRQAGEEVVFPSLTLSISMDDVRCRLR
jgi:hypothetical protein